jgi:hypothetical protein
MLEKDTVAGDCNRFLAFDEIRSRARESSTSVPVDKKIGHSPLKTNVLTISFFHSSMALQPSVGLLASSSVSSFLHRQ